MGRVPVYSMAATLTAVLCLATAWAKTASGEDPYAADIAAANAILQQLDACHNEQVSVLIERLDEDRNKLGLARLGYENRLDDAEHLNGGIGNAAQVESWRQVIDRTNAQMQAIGKVEDELKGLPLCGQPAIPIDVHGGWEEISPSSGSDTDEFGIGGAVSTDPYQDVHLELSGDYRHASDASDESDEIKIDGAAVIEDADLKYGPTLGFDHVERGPFSTDTVSGGGFIQWFVNDYMTGTTHLGLFSQSGSSTYSGVYGGVSGRVFINPNLSIMPFFNYTHYAGPFGFNEADYGVRGEWQFTSGWQPMSVYATFIHAAFPPGAFNDNAVGLGITLHINGADTLAQQQHLIVGPETRFDPLH